MNKDWNVLEDGEEAEEQRRVELLDELEALGELHCLSCQRPLCNHAYVVCVAAGFKTTPRCADCLADGFGRPRNEFLTDALRYIRRQPCYWSGWQWANQHEGHEQQHEQPPCIWQDGETPEETVAAAPIATEAVPIPDAVWDAGDMSCGDLVLELRLRLKKLSAGQVMALTACDPGAPQDIPAWCGLTRHTLIAADHPQYWIRRRED